MTRAGLASRSALCLCLAASALGVGCTTGVIEFVSNTSGASAADCSDGEGPGCEKAESPVQRVCEPGAHRCSSESSQVIETCDESGMAWVQSGACEPGKSCSEGACVEPTKVVGKVVVLGPADSKEVKLAPGKYGLAVVNNALASGGRQLPFPLQISGDLLAQAAAAAAAQAGRRPPLVSRAPRIRLRRAEGARAAATSMPRIYQVGDRRIFNYHDPSSWALSKRVGEMTYSGTTVNVWEDVTTSAKGTVIGEADLREVVRRLENGGVARNAAIFGTPPDVDGNGKIDVFITALQNGKGGYVSSGTLYPEGYYADTDFGEVVYLCGPTESEDAAWLARTVLHEMTHIIFNGVWLQPYLNPPREAPASTGIGAYWGEGPTMLAELLSGQALQDLLIWGFLYPESWALGDLFNEDYDTDEDRNNVLYGMAGLLFAYLFEQSGGVDITNAASVTDRGGQAFLKQFFHGTDAVQRLSLADGRGVQQAYVDMAAALLRGSFLEGLPPLGGAQPSLYAFQPVQQDPVFGHLIGVSQRYEEYYPDEEAGPALARTDWSQRLSTLREGGAAFHDLVVSQGGATLKNTDANTSVVVVRYSDLK